ncbi:MAG: Gfo/Idh/MocA family oxidoreductase [Firmicutes bacterium]|nr:Gfo/Idh/MocA family oxidoreductase [Bacillota bacterium]
MPQIKVGIIGYGAFGRFLHQAWEKLPDLAVTAVSKRRLQPGGLGAIKVYPHWPDLINDPAIDLVVIATPPNLHAEIACAALKASKHILIEKPLATTISAAEQIIRTAEGLPLVASVNFILRYNPIVEALIAICHSGVLGQLRRFAVENYASDSGLPLDHWFWDQEVSGGIFIEHAVHFIDLANQLTDQHPVAVTAFAHRRNPRQEDQVLASVLYSGGLMATHYHHFARPHHLEETSIRLSFDRGQIEISGWIPLAGKLVAMVDPDEIGPLAALPGFKATAEPGHLTATFGINRSKEEIYADCARALMMDLITAIRRPGHRPRVTLADGLSSLLTAVQAREASRQGSHPVVRTNGAPG